MTLNYHHAILRQFPQSYAGLYAPRGIAIDLALAAKQHADYASALREAGLQVSILPPDEAYPDSVFVEDTAVLWGARALIGRLGPTSAHAEDTGRASAYAKGFGGRAGEEQGVAAVLSRTHETMHLPDGATLEGGDVFSTEQATFVGLSVRTNQAGVDALRRFMPDRKVIAVPVEKCFHLKSAVTNLGDGALALDPKLISPEFFKGHDIVEVEPANVIRVGQHLLMLDGYPQAERKLASFAQARGLRVRRVPLTEFEKGDGSITCLSLLW